MKNEKMIASWGKLSPDEEGKNRIMNKVEEKQKKRRPAFRPPMAAVVATAICLAVLGGLFSTPNDANIFSVKTYAFEEQDTGSIGLREIDLLDQPDVWCGVFSDGNFYVSVGLRYEGKNIKSVDFSTMEGFFAKQYINLLDGEDVSKSYVGADNRLVMVGEDFDIAGNRITLDDETQTDDLLLFWGVQATNMSEVPKKIEIAATATFNDGKTQELTVSIDLTGVGAYGGTELFSEKLKRLLDDKRLEYYRTLSIEQCELVPESVKTVTDVYEYKMDDIGMELNFIIEDYWEFDENGIFRCGWWTGADWQVYIAVIKRDDNGVLTGMLYRVSEDLLYISE